MIAVPGASGKHSDGLVELVDLFPTVNIKNKTHTHRQTNKNTLRQINLHTNTLRNKTNKQTRTRKIVKPRSRLWKLLDLHPCPLAQSLPGKREIMIDNNKSTVFFLPHFNIQLICYDMSKWYIEKHPNIEIYPIDI